MLQALFPSDQFRFIVENATPESSEAFTVNGTGVVADSGPIWLAAGDIIGVQGGASCNFCTVSLNGHFSGIEFSVSP